MSSSVQPFPLARTQSSVELNPATETLAHTPYNHTQSCLPTNARQFTFEARHQRRMAIRRTRTFGFINYQPEQANHINSPSNNSELPSLSTPSSTDKHVIPLSPSSAELDDHPKHERKRSVLSPTRSLKVLSQELSQHMAEDEQQVEHQHIATYLPNQVQQVINDATLDNRATPTSTSSSSTSSSSSFSLDLNKYQSLSSAPFSVSQPSVSGSLHSRASISVPLARFLPPDRNSISAAEPKHSFSNDSFSSKHLHLNDSFSSKHRAHYLFSRVVSDEFDSSVRHPSSRCPHFVPSVLRVSVPDNPSHIMILPTKHTVELQGTIQENTINTQQQHDQSPTQLVYEHQLQHSPVGVDGATVSATIVYNDESELNTFCVTEQLEKLAVTPPLSAAPIVDHTSSASSSTSSSSNSPTHDLMLESPFNVGAPLFFRPLPLPLTASNSAANSSRHLPPSAPRLDAALTSRSLCDVLPLVTPEFNFMLNLADDSLFTPRDDPYDTDSDEEEDARTSTLPTQPSSLSLNAQPSMMCHPYYQAVDLRSHAFVHARVPTSIQQHVHQHYKEKAMNELMSHLSIPRLPLDSSCAASGLSTPSIQFSIAPSSQSTSEQHTPHIHASSSPSAHVLQIPAHITHHSNTHHSSSSSNTSATTPRFHNEPTGDDAPAHLVSPHLSPSPHFHSSSSSNAHNVLSPLCLD